MSLLIHLVKSSLFLFLFYGFYWLLLRHTTFFHLNRAYLLLGILASFALPFIHLTEEIPFTPTESALTISELTAGADEPVLAGASTATHPISPSAAEPLLPLGVLLVALYLLGFACFTYRLITNIAGVRRIRRNGKKMQLRGTQVIILPEGSETGSFSFGGSVYMDQRDFDRHFDKVFRHEQTHVRQLHTLDILLIEITRVFLWFNPVTLLYKRGIQDVHEFLADASAKDKQLYASFLVAYTICGSNTYPISQVLRRDSSLKRRIKMLFMKQDPKSAMLRYLLILPLVAVLTVLTASRQYIYQNPGDETVVGRFAAAAPEIREPAVTTSEPVHNNSLPARSEVKPVTLSPSATGDIQVTGQVFGSDDGKPLPGVSVVGKNTHRGTATNIEGRFSIVVTPENPVLVFTFVGYERQTVRITGQRHIKVTLVRNQNVMEKFIVTGYGRTPIDTVENTGKTDAVPREDKLFVVEQMPEFPGGNSALRQYLAKNVVYPSEAANANIQGQVLVSFTVNKLGFIRNPKITRGLGYGTDEEALKIAISMPRWQPGKQNGQPVDVQLTLPIEFRLNQPAERQGYAEPEKGANMGQNEGRPAGIRIVGNHSGSFGNTSVSPPVWLEKIKTEPSLSAWTALKKPLYLLNGKEIGGLENVDPAMIASISVLKNVAAAPYGEKGKNGVILITLKEPK